MLEELEELHAIKLEELEELLVELPPSLLGWIWVLLPFPFKEINSPLPVSQAILSLHV
jgi:hypothetical protein